MIDHAPSSAKVQAAVERLERDLRNYGPGTPGSLIAVRYKDVTTLLAAQQQMERLRAAVYALAHRCEAFPCTDFADLYGAWSDRYGRVCRAHIETLRGWVDEGVLLISDLASGGIARAALADAPAGKE